jgi:CBS domain-containing protein
MSVLGAGRAFKRLEVTMYTPLDALRELAATRDTVRLQLHLLSMDARARWNELEAVLESMESEFQGMSDRPSDVVVAKVRALTETVKDFVLSHSAQRSDAAATVSSIMTHTVQTCAPGDHLNEVAHRLWETNCGSLPVVRSDGSLAGMITDRDVCMACYTQGASPSELTVSSSMSREIFTCSPDDPIGRALEIMADRQVRRIPVTREDDGRLLGIVALADIARWAQATPTHNAEREALLRTLAAVSAPLRVSPARAAAE